MHYRTVHRYPLLAPVSPLHSIARDPLHIYPIDSFFLHILPHPVLPSFLRPSFSVCSKHFNFVHSPCQQIEYRFLSFERVPSVLSPLILNLRTHITINVGLLIFILRTSWNWFSLPQALLLTKGGGHLADSVFQCLVCS